MAGKHRGLRNTFRARGKTRSLDVRIDELKDKLDKLDLMSKIKELKAKVKRR